MDNPYGFLGILSGLRTRLFGHVKVGAGSRVNWFRLRATRGHLVIGQGSIVNCRVDFDSPAGVVEIGNRTFIGASHLVCHTRITIGDDSLISWGVEVVDHDSHSLDWHHRRNDVSAWMKGEKDWSNVTVKPVRIGNRTWIGFGAAILKGVTVGEGSIIGARAVVTRDVEPYTVVAGNPARVVRVQTNPNPPVG
jgi:acetyltransferase-like isoleucine patch superfamily enzyme